MTWEDVMQVTKRDRQTDQLLWGWEPWGERGCSRISSATLFLGLAFLHPPGLPEAPLYA